MKGWKVIFEAENPTFITVEQTGKSISKITMPGYIFDLSFNAEGRYLAIGHTGEMNSKKDGDVRIDVWNLTLN
ncbi:hypothetical protein [Anaerosinus massiliensis]|uniref:hypothetical protein n=1 Tax=Massilibacillus massiliensis TaxID=1806837 RepID=UPI000DA60462|nr:hypothetical protein [Massilibacillus massiliensis]